MDTTFGSNGSQGRVFRQHPLVTLALPSLPWIVATGLLCAAAIYLQRLSGYALGLAILALVPSARVLHLYLSWWAYSVSITERPPTVRERSGILNVSERIIPLSRLISVRYSRPWWATLLHVDVADAVVEGAIGETLVLTAIGGFSRLWASLQSRGQARSPNQPSGQGPAQRRAGPQGLDPWLRLAMALGGWVAAVARPVRQAIHRSGFAQKERSGQPGPGNPDGGTWYRGVRFSAERPSRAGFLAFCEQFVLAERTWTRRHTRTPDAGRRYYPDGISGRVVDVYLGSLRQAHILIPGPPGQGGERLSGRVRTIDDIARLVPDAPESSRAAA